MPGSISPACMVANLYVHLTIYLQVQERWVNQIPDEASRVNLEKARKRIAWLRLDPILSCFKRNRSKWKNKPVPVCAFCFLNFNLMNCYVKFVLLTVQTFLCVTVCFSPAFPLKYLMADSKQKGHFRVFLLAWIYSLLPQEWLSQVC